MIKNMRVSISLQILYTTLVQISLYNFDFGVKISAILHNTLFIPGTM